MDYLLGIPMIVGVGWVVAQVGRAGGWHVPNDVGLFGYGMLGLLSFLFACPFVMVGFVLWATFTPGRFPIYSTVLGLAFFGGISFFFARTLWQSRKR